MKKALLIVLSAMLLFTLNVNGQNQDSLATCKNLEDTLACLKKTFLEPQNKFIGKPAKEVFDVCKRILPVKYATTIETSPYIDPQNIAYLKGIYIYNKKVEELRAIKERQGKYINLLVYFEDSHIICYDFEQSIPEEDWENCDKFLKYFEKFIVKEIKIFILDWNK